MNPIVAGCIESQIVKLNEGESSFTYLSLLIVARICLILFLEFLQTMPNVEKMYQIWP